jgi:hypothetical protein
VIRLAFYWKSRKQVFLERWLLPLNLSGKGALTQEEVDWIKTGVIVTRKTPSGATVVYTDFHQADDCLLQDEYLAPRATFFMNTTTIDEDNQKHGIYIIKAIAPNFFLQKKRKGLLWDLLRKAFPVRVKKIFLLARNSLNLSESLQFTTLCMHGWAAEFFWGDRPTFITESSSSTTQKLLAAGLSLDSIPYFLGGSWDCKGLESVRDDYHSTSSSITDRKPKAKASSKSLSVSTFVTAQQARVEEQPTVKPKRKRGRPPKDHVEESYEELKANSNGPQDFIKKRNALYSRRLYHKKKKEAGSIHVTIYALGEENRRLHLEGSRLERLFAQAQLLISLDSSGGQTEQASDDNMSPSLLDFESPSSAPAELAVSPPFLTALSMSSIFSADRIPHGDLPTAGSEAPVDAAAFAGSGPRMASSAKSAASADLPRPTQPW